jgi:ribosomal protein L31
MSEKGIKVLINCKLLPNLKSLNFNFSKHCIFGKQCKQKFKIDSHISKGVLDYIHSNVWGESHTIYFIRSSYFVTFIDDNSRKVWVYVIKRKVDVFNVFKQFRVLVEKGTDRKSSV